MRNVKPMQPASSRARNNARHPGTAQTPRRRVLFEGLESRLLLSADLVGIPLWNDQGPAPTTGGQVAGLVGNPVSGAIEAIAAHPTDPDIAYVAAVNGGIWRTNNATAASPNWTPLTDAYPGLSMGAISISPLDNNVVFAGTANYSSGGRDGGPRVGLLRSTDGGATWTNLGQAEFSNLNVRSVVPTGLGGSLTDQVVLVAATNGVWRSPDGGQTWTQISGAAGTGLPNGNASQLVADPGNASRFYTAVVGAGVYRSDNGGQTWSQVNTGLDLTTDGIDNDGDGAIDEGDEDANGAGRIELSVHNSAGNNVVYAALIGAGANDQLMGVFRSTNQGANWTVLGTAPAIHPGTQGNIHFSMLADLNDPNLVYVGGDRQASAPFVANMFVGDASTNTWSSIVLAGASGTAPHADSRDMVFDANGNLLEADDGGIFRLVNPSAAGRTWQSVNGNITPTELYFVGYDNVNNVIFGGTQDTGTTEQSGAGSSIWNQITQGDGGYAGTGNAGSSSTRYTMGNNYNTFSRRVFDNSNNLLSNNQVQLAATAGGAQNGGLNATDQGVTGFVFTPFIINAVDPTRMLLGMSGLYEDDQTGTAHATGDVISNITPAGYGGTVSLAYGGRSGGSDNPDVAYVGDGNGEVWLRSAAGGAFTKTNYNTTPGTGSALDIVLDPEDWNTAYVLDGDDIWTTSDAGGNWVSLTGNLNDYTSDLRTIALFDDGTDVVVLAGGQGGVYRTINPGASPRWTEYGTQLPNAIVKDLIYDASDDALVAATYGRGAFKVTSASTSLATSGRLVVDGVAGLDDTIRLVRQSNNPLLLDVYQNNPVAPILSIEWSTLEGIEVNGFDGSDTLTIDFGFGDVVPFDGVDYDGGIEAPGSDSLVLENGTFNVVTYTASGPGAGAVELDDNRVTYAFLEPVLDTTTADSRVFINDTGAAVTIHLVDDGVAANDLARIDDGGTAAFETVTFRNPESSLTINAGDNGETIDLEAIDANMTAGITVNGGTGNDIITVSVSPPAPVGVNGNAGNDDITVNFGNLAGAVNVQGGGDNDTLTVNGTSGADTISVTATSVERGSETVNYAGIEDLTVDADAGDDSVTVDGASGTVLGGLGHDTLEVDASGAGGLLLDGEEDGDDFIVNFGSLAGIVTVQDTGPSGSDTLRVNGTAGADLLVITAASVTRLPERVDYSGIEALTVDAGAGADIITVDSTGTTTTVLGGDGDDDFTVNANGPFTLTLDGQEDSDSYAINLGSLLGPVVVADTGINGIDSLLIGGTPGDDVIILTDTTITGAGGSITFSGIELLSVSAGDGNDLVDGSALTISVIIFGGNGDDTLLGGSNDDELYGEADNDDLIGNLGADLLDGGDGSDGLVGDKGSISREVVAGPERVLSIPSGHLIAIVDRPGTIRRNVLLIDADQGGDDTLRGGDGDDYLHGGAGNDHLFGDAGMDALFGNDGSDDMAGGDGDDHLFGGDGNDELDGGLGVDIAYGGSGDDRLIADRSQDRLIDWFGNFNDFIVPGPGYGGQTIVRSPSPWVLDFLLNLGRSDGAMDPNSELRVVIPGSDGQRGNSGKGGRSG